MRRYGPRGHEAHETFALGPNNDVLCGPQAEAISQNLQLVLSSAQIIETFWAKQEKCLATWNDKTAFFPLRNQTAHSEDRRASHLRKFQA
jgi:hypothetical protein